LVDDEAEDEDDDPAYADRGEVNDGDTGCILRKLFLNCSACADSTQRDTRQI
jgi:hypothetical protein